MQLRVIAPSFKISDTELQKTLNLLESLGEQHSFGFNKPLFQSGYLCAASNEKRLKDVVTALKDPKSDVIWCLRGGYGCLHLLPDLLKLNSKDLVQKMLVGFSDITILHYYLNQILDWPTLHFRHLNSFVKDQSVKAAVKEFSSTYKTLNKKEELVFKNLKPLNSLAEKSKSISAPIVGGNLITMQSMIGLDVPKPKAQILFLEEIEEPIYKIDRALTQLSLAGWLDDVRAIVLGSFTHSDKNVEKSTKEYLKTNFKDFSVPVFGFLPCGHVQPQKPLFFGTPSKIKTTSSGFELSNSVVKF